MTPEPPARPVAAPRPSRGARWGIGLAVAGVLALVGLVGGAVAIGQAVSSGGECVTDPGAPGIFCTDSAYIGRATATVTASQANVDPFFGDSADAPGWFVDVAFTTQDGESVEAYGVEWPRGTAQPGEGSRVLVAYDPADPEFSVAAASALDAKAAAEPAEASPAALWTTGLGFAAALAALAGTVVWARRAPRRERPVPAGWSVPGYGYPPPGYGYPPPGYGYPPPGYGYPQQGYPPPGYQPGYPPGYAPPGYGPPPSAPSPAPPAPPPAPPPSGPPAAPPQPGGWNAPG